MFCRLNQYEGIQTLSIALIAAFILCQIMLKTRIAVIRSTFDDENDENLIVVTLSTSDDKNLINVTWSTHDDENDENLMIVTWSTSDDENLIFVTWSNHLAANPHDGSAGKQAVSNTAKDDGALHYNAVHCTTLKCIFLEILHCIANLHTILKCFIGKLQCNIIKW